MSNSRSRKTMATPIPINQRLKEKFGTWIECEYCHEWIQPGEPREEALDRESVLIGVTHAGTCSHQWRLSVSVSAPESSQENK